MWRLIFFASISILYRVGDANSTGDLTIADLLKSYVIVPRMFNKSSKFQGGNLTSTFAVVRELGHGVPVLIASQFGAVFLKNVACSSASMRVACFHPFWGQAQCRFELLNVTGVTLAVICPEIKITGTDYPFIGRVDVLRSDVWTPVCADQWTTTSAQVACRQLQLRYNSSLSRTTEAETPFLNFTQNYNTSELVTGLNCSGNELTLLSCRHQPRTSGMCTGQGAAGVICEADGQAINSTIIAQVCNTAGIQCYCREGYILRSTGDGSACVDNDECNKTTRVCPVNSSCSNTLGSFSCTCKTGYSGGRSIGCLNIDECNQVDSKCGLNSICSDTDGSFDCLCKQGFEKSSDDACVDVDECSETPCGDNTICDNTIGGYNCTCRPGYKNDSEQCVDVDECAAGRSDCDVRERAKCTNVVGSFLCQCLPEYSGDGRNCTLGDANSTGNLTIADLLKSYVIAPRMFNKSPMFQGGNLTSTFADVRALEHGVPVLIASQFGAVFLKNVACSSASMRVACFHPFWGQAQCRFELLNVTGVTVAVICPEIKITGTDYPFIGRVDVLRSDVWTPVCADQWKTTSAQVACRQLQLRYNSSLSRTTEAETPFLNFTQNYNTSELVTGLNCSGNELTLLSCRHQPRTSGMCTGQGAAGVICEADGQAINSTIIAQVCNTAGIQCYCREGYILRSTGDGSACVDNDECNKTTRVCPVNSSCSNTLGSFSCTCKTGYSGGRSIGCLNIDECNQVDSKCGLNSICSDTDGSFDCLCKQGFEKSSDDACVDVDECSETPCGDNTICDNTIGGYNCTCRPGYKNDSEQCVDVDECAAGRSDCDVRERAKCTNVVGSFLCQCLPEYSGDGRNCTRAAFVTAIMPPEIRAFQDRPLRIPCFYGGHPTPLVKWCLVNLSSPDNCTHVESSACPVREDAMAPSRVLELVIDVVMPCHTGSYRCEALNDVALKPATTQVIVSVLAASNFLIVATYMPLTREDAEQAPSLVANTLVNLFADVMGTTIREDAIRITFDFPGGTVIEAAAEIRLPTTSITGVIGNSSVIDGLKKHIIDEILSGRSEPLRADAESLFIRGFDICTAESTEDLRGTFNWPETIIDTPVTIECPVRVSDTQRLMATRQCVRTPRPIENVYPRGSTFQADWGPPNTTACPFASAITRELQTLTQVSFNASQPDAIVSSTDTIRNLTRNTTFLSSTDVDFTSVALFNLITATSDRDAGALNETVAIEIANNVLESFSNILDVPIEAIDSGPAARLTSSLETLVTSIQPANGQSVQVDTANLAFSVVCLADVLAQGVRAESSGLGIGPVSNLTSVTASLADVALDVPQDGIELATLNVSNNSNCASATTQFIVYRTTSLFQDPTLDNESRLASQVISVQIGNLDTVPLEEPSMMSFGVNTSDLLENETAFFTCVFWDTSLNDNLGGWSTDGCSLANASSTRVICQCDHLTNFAILVSRRALLSTETPTDAQKALSIISYIGCGLSMTGLLASMITTLAIQKLRSSNTQRMVFGLCATLFLLLLLFVAGITATNNMVACKAIAMLMHYLLLSAFMWMCAEATLLYRQLVTVFPGQSSSVMTLLLVLIFGLPLLVVATSAGATQLDAYATSQYCWISNFNVFIGGLVVPLALSLLYNVTTLVLVIRSLHQSRLSSKAAKKKTASSSKYYIKVVVALSALLGSTWVFGLLVVLYDHISFQYIFAILNTSQGFVIFVMHTARAKEVRKEWKQTSSTAHRTLRTYLTGKHRWSSTGSSVDVSNVYSTSTLKSGIATMASGRSRQETTDTEAGENVYSYINTAATLAQDNVYDSINENTGASKVQYMHERRVEDMSEVVDDSQDMYETDDYQKKEVHELDQLGVTAFDGILISNPEADDNDPRREIETEVSRL